MTLPFDNNALDNAYRQVCRQRKHFPANADIWHLRYHWPTEHDRIQQALRKGTWVFKPLSVVTRASGESVAVWSSDDALVIHCLTRWLRDRLPVHVSCEHVRGHGGGWASVRRVCQLTKAREYPFICRTDIRQYYANMDKTRLISRIEQYVDDPMVLGLLTQIIHYTVENGGLFHTPAKGIARGSAISPLLAAFHLFTLDQLMTSNPHIHYVYMDDFLIFARTRWHLRKAVRQLNGMLATLGFTQHPDKTFIGKVEKGFDWMGFFFNADGCVSVAPRALSNHSRKLRRLYEQTHCRYTEEQALIRVAAYTTRWLRWTGDYAPSLTFRITGEWP